MPGSPPPEPRPVAQVLKRNSSPAPAGAPGPGGSGGALECKIRTIGYGPGEYMVDVSPDGDFAEGRTEARRLVVEAAGPGEAPRSGAWYLAPIFLGLLGGAVAYFALRRDSPRMAANCLIVGLAITVLVFVVPALLLAFASPQPAPGAHLP